MPTALTALVERGKELAGIDGRLGGLPAGEPVALLIEGPAGIGKTSLLRHALDVARAHGCTVLTATGTELEADLTFGVARQLFASLMSRPDAEALFEGPAARARIALDFELEDPSEAGPPALAAAFHGLHWLTLGLAATDGVLLAVDDAQWADAESLRWLHYLVRRIADVPVGLVLTVRTGEALDREPLIAALRDEPLLQDIRPAPLSTAATVDVIRARVPTASDAFCRAAHDVCAGNPFLLEELVTTFVADGRSLDDDDAASVPELATRQVAQSVLLRIARGSRAAVDVARAIAILGASATLSRIAVLAAVDDLQARSVVEALVAADVLAPGLPLGFRHPLVRQSVYADMPPASRAARHREAAQLLIADGAADEEVASQLLLSETTGLAAAAGVLRRAARHAHSVGSARTAALMLRRALDEPTGPDRAAILLELGRAEVAAGDGAGLTHLQEALALTEGSSTRVDAVLALTDALQADAEGGRALEVLEAERATVRADDPDTAARLATAWGFLLMQVNRSWPGTYDTLLQADSPQLQPSTRRPLNAAIALSAPTRAERLERSLLAWGDGALMEDVGLDSLLPHQLAGGLAQDGFLVEATAMMGRLVAAAQDRGSPLATAVAINGRASIAMLQGDLLRAESDALLTLDLASQGGWTLGVIAGLSLAAVVTMDRGRLDEAQALLTAAPEAPSPLYGAVLLARAGLRIRQSRWEEALDDLDEADRQANRSTDTDDVFRQDFMRAEVLAALGRRAEARTLVDAKLAIARRMEIAIALVDGALARARTAEPEDAVQAWTEALSAVESFPFAVSTARALVGLGAAQRRAKQITAARESLQRALDLATRCHADGLVALASDELAATGARARRRAAIGVDALSPSERRVCQLAAEGLSNTRIAQTLFVSVKTVETQLSSSYRKLGVSGRADLASAMAAPV